MIWEPQPPPLDPEQKAFFDGAGAVLEDFARERGLSIEKWIKEIPVWALHFRHPRKGTGQIVVAPGKSGAASLQACWWRDDYDSETRRLAWDKPAEVPRERLAESLDAVLARMLAWTDADLAQTASLKGVWKKAWTKEQFEKFDAQYPDPRRPGGTMKIAIVVCRVLLGLGFTVFGANILHPFLPMPPIPPDSPMGRFMAVMVPSHWMDVVGLFQLAGGLLVLSGRAAPIGLTLLGPVLVNILAFHVCIMRGEGIGPGLVFSALEIFLIYGYRGYFRQLFTLRAAPTIE